MAVVENGGTDLAGLMALANNNKQDDSMGKYLGLAIAAKALGFGVNDTASLVHPLTAADVNAAIAANTLQQTTGSLSGEIWKAEGTLQTAISAASSTQLVQSLQAEIAILQGQSNIVNAITASQGMVVNEIHENADRVLENVVAGNAIIVSTITNDGDKTRALISNIETANLNRQLVVAENRIAELLGDRNGAAALNGITIMNNNAATAVAQQQQQQQQAQFNILTSGLACLMQHAQATNTAITMGNGNHTKQDAAALNVK